MHLSAPRLRHCLTRAKEKVKQPQENQNTKNIWSRRSDSSRLGSRCAGSWRSFSFHSHQLFLPSSQTGDVCHLNSSSSMSKATDRVDQFMEEFNSMKNGMERQLLAANPDVTWLTFELPKMEKLLSESAAFIPPYTCKICQESVDSLRKQINEKRGFEAPKKKFTFGKKASAPAVAVNAQEKSCHEVNVMNRSSLLGRRNLTNEQLTLDRQEFHLKDFELESLVNCTIHLPGSPMTLILRKLNNCEINCGPVASSIYIDGCTNCSFNLAFQQLRIHSSLNCTFYVYAKTKPILENCKAMTFGVYNYVYEDLEQDKRGTGFTNETENLYNQVVDFDWLSTEQSPNWSVL